MDKLKADGVYGHLTSRAFRNTKIMIKWIEILLIMMWGSLGVG